MSATPSPGRSGKQRVAVVLFNLGGPDSPDAIKPFLLNLFRDPAILRVPFVFRPLLARLIARARVKPATANYMLLGGKSPLLDLTEKQASALEAALPDIEAKCFIAMRYWHPMSLEAARAVKAWGADRVVLLPLYPQFSTTTTGSSLTAWREAAARANLVVPTMTICCYPRDDRYVRGTAALLVRTLDSARAGVGLVVQPIAFVSEHSETLVELDVEYREFAEKLGVEHYFRVPAQNDDAGFVAAMAGLVRSALARGPGLCSYAGQGTCPANHGDCPHVKAGLRIVSAGSEPPPLRLAA